MLLHFLLLPLFLHPREIPQSCVVGGATSANRRRRQLSEAIKISFAAEISSRLFEPPELRYVRNWLLPPMLIRPSFAAGLLSGFTKRRISRTGRSIGAQHFDVFI